MQNVEQNDAKCGKKMQQLAEIWYTLCGKNIYMSKMRKGGFGSGRRAIPSPVQNVEQNGANYGDIIFFFHV